MSNDLQKATIIYSGVEQKSGQSGDRTWTKYKLTDENKRGYSFFETKSDGTKSRAFEDFKKMAIGDKVEVAYKEEPGEYNGKEVTYRTAVMFTKVSGNAPTTRPAATIAPDALKSLTTRVEVLEGLVRQMAGEDAWEVHSSTHAHSKAASPDEIPVIKPKDDINPDDLGF